MHMLLGTRHPWQAPCLDVAYDSVQAPLALLHPLKVVQLQLLVLWVAGPEAGRGGGAANRDTS